MLFLNKTRKMDVQTHNICMCESVCKSMILKIYPYIHVVHDLNELEKRCCLIVSGAVIILNDTGSTKLNLLITRIAEYEVLKCQYFP
jgi:hypothetical protein